MKQKKPRNPFLKMMQNTRSIAFVRSKSTSGISGEVMRKQHSISIDENDVEKQFFKQNGKSDMLGIDIDPRYYDYVVEVLMSKRNNGYGVL